MDDKGGTHTGEVAGSLFLPILQVAVRRVSDEVVIRRHHGPGSGVPMLLRDWSRTLEGEREQPVMGIVDGDAPVDEIAVALGLGAAPRQSQAGEDQVRS